VLREALTFERISAMEPEDAAALFVSLRAEGLTPSEEDVLAAWLVADEVHSREFDDALVAWESFPGAEDDEIVAALTAHALATKARRRWTDWRYAAAAAAALVLILVSSLFILGRQPPVPGGESAIEYASAHGQVRAITLADGGTMTLDADSAATVRFGAKVRSIELKRGRAFFEVAHDLSRPFEVAAAGRRIIATGTRFEVDLAPGVLKVALLEGGITVGPLDRDVQPVRLTPGQQFVERAGVPVIRRLDGGGDVTGWRQGLIDFDDEPLSEAVIEVNRHASEQLVIRDRAVAAMRISGQFRAGDSAGFARAVSEVYPVRVVRRGGRIELVPAG
jgi:transmembrane sensor